ncbi:isochorismatase family protein [Jannaschia sp. S6380]|uniref:isochorismatase family protein n=1 Tax=Jannaschia sp. S6380 TaxID=2926408 RepID=UPI001FF5670A|nr:isochorismatase family protein [Jannaschia sp. S6380]MCK0167264.1 isochorismatase family protein [Jannaschia sp. S6380]
MRLPLILAATILAGPAAAQDMPAALERLDPEDAILVLVDFTSGFYPIVDTIEVDEMLNNAVGTAKLARTFDIPIMVLGDEGGFYGEMHPAIRSFAGGGQPFTRTTPSDWASGGFQDAVEATGRQTVLIGGITTDNCTLLTSLDLLRDGYDVRVITDISGSDSASAEQAALMRLRDAGAMTTSWITIGSELIEDWQTPEGEAVTMIYGKHMNGPSTSTAGGTMNDASIGEQNR